MRIFTEADFKGSDGDLKVIKHGMLHLIVCVPKDMPIAEVNERANRCIPTGMTHGWEVASEGMLEKYPNLKPVECGEELDRTHYVLIC